jgi:hypothetical protein
LKDQEDTKKKKINSFLPNLSLAPRENSDTPERILGTLGNFILPDNFGHVRKVEENFHLCPKHFGTLKKIKLMLENFWQFHNLYFSR